MLEMWLRTVFPEIVGYLLVAPASGDEELDRQVSLASRYTRCTALSRRWRMATRPRGLRLPEELEGEIERERKLRGGLSFSEMATQLLREAVRMRRVPGIVFMDGPVGRRAAIAGTGLDVWEVVTQFREVGGDYEQLQSCYEWLSEPQLRAALEYYGLYPEEINARIEREEHWTSERVWKEFPFTRPRARPGRSEDAS